VAIAQPLVTAALRALGYRPAPSRAPREAELRASQRAASFMKPYLYAVGATPYLFTAGLRSHRHRALIHAIARHFGYGTATMPPLVSPEQLLSNADCVQAHELVSVNGGGVSFLELLVLSALVAQSRPRAIFEIGTFEGRTTLNFAMNAPTSRVYTLDLPPSQVDATALPIEHGERSCIQKPASGRKFLGAPAAERIVQLFGDSATFDFRAYEGEMDFVFVDGSHADDYVLNDTEVAFRLLRQDRGVIVWHDYGSWPGVARVLDRLYRSRPEFRGLRHVEGTTLACLMR
jgi:predicted O-methyltransferase YrrM